MKMKVIWKMENEIWKIKMRFTQNENIRIGASGRNG